MYCMKNFWLDQLKIGKNVKYIGPDTAIHGLVGVVNRVQDGWIVVTFIKNGKALSLTLEKEYLQISRS
jgi:hypothetical protein